jgi:hypothetical protein
MTILWIDRSLINTYSATAVQRLGANVVWSWKGEGKVDWLSDKG